MSADRFGPPGDGVDVPAGDRDVPTELPPAVRARVLAAASDVLGGLEEPAVPSSLRAVRRFTPAKRTRLGATALAMALANDEDFAAAVAAVVADAAPDLAAALQAGAPPAAADPVEVAALAYLVRSPAAAELAGRAAREAALAVDAGGAAERDRLAATVERLTVDHRAEGERWKAELLEARAEVDELRRRVRGADALAARATAELRVCRRAVEDAERAAVEAAARVTRDAAAELRRLRARLAEAEAAQAADRRATRDARGVDSVRLKILLDTVLTAAAGLKRELDLPAVVERPADGVAAARGAELPSDPLADVFAARAQPRDDPGRLDAALSVPNLHLLVDGYNVTKLGYGELSLEDQRRRLLVGLAGLAARAPAVEVTCVFDGTAATTRPTAVAVPRGVRVLFSAVGELADDLLVRLVHAEPAGRAVLVVTNDRAIGLAVAEAGARSLPSDALLSRLDRA